jgi:hypothetical protein
MLILNLYVNVLPQYTVSKKKPLLFINTIKNRYGLVNIGKTGKYVTYNVKM